MWTNCSTDRRGTVSFSSPSCAACLDRIIISEPIPVTSLSCPTTATVWTTVKQRFCERPLRYVCCSFESQDAKFTQLHNHFMGILTMYIPFIRRIKAPFSYLFLFVSLLCRLLSMSWFMWSVEAFDAGFHDRDAMTKTTRSTVVSVSIAVCLLRWQLRQEMCRQSRELLINAKQLTMWGCEKVGGLGFIINVIVSSNSPSIKSLWWWFCSKAAFVFIIPSHTEWTLTVR